MKSFSIIYIFTLILVVSPEYSKDYFDNGKLKSEGWIQNDMKVKYWYFYYNNGNLKSKGHFVEDEKNGYWYFYNPDGEISTEGSYNNGNKTEWWKIYNADTIEEVKYENSKKEGLSIHRVKGQPVKAEYYQNGIKTHEWYSLKEFRKDYSNL